MKNRVAILVFASLVFFMLLILPAFAHHGNAAYDNRTVTVKGVVTEWRWTNPHSFLKFDAKDEKGNVVQWIGEWNNPSTLINLLSAVFNTCGQGLNPENDSSTGHVKIAVTGSTEATVLRRHIVRSFDVGKVLAFGAEYLNPSRRCGKSVARAVNA